MLAFRGKFAFPAISIAETFARESEVMPNKLRLLELFDGKRYQKAILAVSVIGFLVLELVIYLAAAGQAGQKSRVLILDSNGSKMYETVGAALTSYEKLVFETNYGPLQNYKVHVETEILPFPFRAWLSGAVGIPVGLVLLVSFVVRVYLSLLYGEEKDEKENGEVRIDGQNRFGSLLRLFQNVSIFHIGFFVLIAVLLLWLVPNFIGDFVTVSMTAIKEYKWFFLGASIVLAAIVAWIIHLRYKLSKQMLDNQLELEKFRLEKQFLLQQPDAALRMLPNSMNEVHEP